MTVYRFPDGRVGSVYDCIGYVEARYTKGMFFDEVVKRYNRPEDYADLTASELNDMYHGYICESIAEDPQVLRDRFGIIMEGRSCRAYVRSAAPTP